MIKMNVTVRNQTTDSFAAFERNKLNMHKVNMLKVKAKLMVTLESISFDRSSQLFVIITSTDIRFGTYPEIVMYIKEYYNG